MTTDHRDPKKAPRGRGGLPPAPPRSTPKGGAPRQTPRFPLHCRVLFAAGHQQREGSLTDLSKAGCKIRCPASVELGMELQLSLFVPNHARPLTVDRAVVRWERGEEFGAEFLSLQPAEQERLGLFLTSLKKDAKT